MIEFFKSIERLEWALLPGAHKYFDRALDSFVEIMIYILVTGFIIVNWWKK